MFQFNEEFLKESCDEGEINILRKDYKRFSVTTKLNRGDQEWSRFYGNVDSESFTPSENTTQEEIEEETRKEEEKREIFENQERETEQMCLNLSKIHTELQSDEKTLKEMEELLETRKRNLKLVNVRKRKFRDSMKELYMEQRNLLLNLSFLRQVRSVEIQFYKLSNDKKSLELSVFLCHKKKVNLIMFFNLSKSGSWSLVRARLGETIVGSDSIIQDAVNEGGGAQSLISELNDLISRI